MTTRRVLAPAAFLVLVAALVATTVSSPALARPAADRVDSRCLHGGPIPVSALKAMTRLGCSLVGRVVRDGRVAMRVPPAGMSVVGEGVGMHRDPRGLRITNTGTTVRVVREGASGGGGGWYLAPLSTDPSPSTPAAIITNGTTTTTGTMVMTSTRVSSRVQSQRAGARPACKDRTFNLEHHKWTRALRYRINLGKMPPRFSSKTVVRQIQVANGNMRKGRNTCGKPRLKTPVSHYLGRTKTKPDISAAGPSCGTGNTTNVVGFGALPGGLLGWTCYWYIGGRMVGSDMMIDNGPNLATKLPTTCSNLWDFEGTVTHEWGHAYGMAHTGDGHDNLTMQHLLKPCSTYARTLGLGDWLGMKKMYGAR